MYDEERQVQRVHVNSNAEESTQYQTYSQNSEIASSSGNNWIDPLSLKSEKDQRKMKMMT